MPAETRRTIARLELPLILLIAAAAIMLARPYGNFPLNDDAHYAVAAWDYARTGHFHLTLATVPSLRAQVVWGALFTRMFGESFEVLRASTMTLAVLTLLLINRLLALLPIPRSLRIVATLALLFHPIFFLSGCTFMTELPFVFASVAAMYFYVLGIRDEHIVLILLGGLAAAISWWVRQTGILNAIAPLGALVVFRQHIAERYRRMIVAAAVPVVAFFVILAIRPDLLSGSQREFSMHYRMWSEETFRLPQQVALIFHYCLFNAQNNALFLLPLAVAVDWRLFRSAHARVIAVVSALVFLGGMTQLVALGHPMPYSAAPRCCDIAPGHLFIDFGLGPLTLPDDGSYPFKMPYFPRVLLSYVVTLLAAAMVAAIFVRLIDAVRRPKSNVIFLLAFAHALIGTAALCASTAYYDRYALDATWSAALLIPCVIRWDVRPLRVAPAAALLVIATFSIFATGEYFAWHRAQWQAYDWYKTQGGDVKELDSGVEAFAYFEVAPVKDYRQRRKQFFGSYNRHYRIAFSQAPNYRDIRAFPYSGWLGLHRANIYLQEKLDRAP